MIVIGRWFPVVIVLTWTLASWAAELEPQAQRGAQPSPTTSAAGAEPSFSTAVLTYQYSGQKTGKETVYVDRGRNRIALERHLKQTLLSITRSKDERVIYDGKTLYTIRPNENLAIKVDRTGDALREVFGDIAALGVPVGSDSVLGRECQLYRSSAQEICVWNGLSLRERVTHPFGEQYNFEKQAIELQLDTAMPEEPFTLPAGIQVRTIGEMFTELGQVLEKAVEGSGQPPKSQ